MKTLQGSHLNLLQPHPHLRQVLDLRAKCCLAVRARAIHHLHSLQRVCGTQPTRRGRGTSYDSEVLVNCALQSTNEALRVTEDDVEDCIERICWAVGAKQSGNEGHFAVSGTQNLLGMAGNWRLQWNNSDGRFWEQFDGEDMTLEWAYDGNSQAWAVDAAGRISRLELDDREVCILTSWIRTCFWVTERGREQLSICLEQDNIADVDTASCSELILSVRLTGSKVVAYVIIDHTTWYPLRTSIRAFGGWSKWHYSDWQPLLAGQSGLFPFSCIHTQASGNTECYSVRICSVDADDGIEDNKAICSVYYRPDVFTLLRPQLNHPHAHIDSTCPPSVQMIRAESGHYLVRPLVNGKDIGFFIVDTGSSSLTIAPQKARELDLYAFGDVHITGAEGEVKSQYSRAVSFHLGPLRIANPVFMEVPMAGLPGALVPVAGICGYDVFIHCVIEMAYDKGTLSIFDPLGYRPSYFQELQWQTMQMIENVPHLSATFNGHTALLLLDSGAGGVDVIFHRRAVEEFDLHSIVQSVSPAELMGISTSGEGLQMEFGILNELDLAGWSFRQVKVLLSQKKSGNLETSEYTAGLLCGDLLMRYRVVFDYRGRRVAFIRKSAMQ